MQFFTHDKGRPASFLLLCLLLVSLAFIVLHVLEHNGLLSDPLFNLGREQGYSALYLFALELFLSLLMAGLALTFRQPVYIHWTALFAYFFLDDLLEIHETVGGALAVIWRFPTLLQLRPQDWGELVVYVTTGLYFLLTLLLTYRRSDSAARHFSRRLTVQMLMLVAVGIGADMAYYLVSSPLLKQMFVILEDGGEIVMISLILWSVALRLARLPLTQLRAAGHGGIVLLRKRLPSWNEGKDSSLRY